MQNETKRPKDMTTEELRELPDGGGISYVDRPATPEEVERLGATKIRQAVAPSLMATHFREDDLLSWVDPDTDDAFTFGQFSDGRWFKRAS